MAAILFFRHFKGQDGVGRNYIRCCQIQHTQIVYSRWFLHFSPKMPLGVTNPESSTCLVWPTLGSRTAEEQNRTFMLPTVILIIISFPSPTHSFTPGLKPSFSANPSHRSLSFFFFRTDYMIPQTFTVTSDEHIRFYFLLFLFLHFSLVGSVR